MSQPSLGPTYTVDEYLAFERASEERHEYLDGEIFDMAGESGAHADISVNLIGTIASQLKGKPCRARAKETKVRSGPAPTPARNKTGLYSYPDLVIICDEPKYHDERKDIILNPTATIEVLSPSTEAFDREQKFHRYQVWNPTLQDYVLVSQDRPQTEIFSRQKDGTWSYQVHSGLENSVVIGSIDCTLKLADVYDRVVFPTTE